MSVETIALLERKLEHSLRRLAEKQKEHNEIGGPCELTYHGGRAIGHLEGKIWILEDVLDMLKEEKL